jgi:ribose 5-phosphate isomerase
MQTLGSNILHSATKVLTTVNASYVTNVTAHELAAKIVDPKSAQKADAAAFAFFSEVDPALQKAFIKDMGADMIKVKIVASQFAKRAGFSLALAD